MERIVNAEHLYSNIKELLEAQRDVEDVRKQLGIIHLRILQRDVLKRTEERDCSKELVVYNKIAFYLLTKLTNFEYDEAVYLEGMEIAAFCFEVLFKSKMYVPQEEIEYGIFSSICYTLAENQANSIIIANKIIENYEECCKTGKYLYLYACFLARKYKEISRMTVTDDTLIKEIVLFSKSMIYRNEEKDYLRGLKDVLFQLRDEQSEDYYMFRLIYLVAKRMDTYSIRNLLNDNSDLVDYIDVLTQKEIRNVFELWQSQKFLFEALEQIRETDDIFFLSLPTSAGKTLVSELILYKFLSYKRGIAIYIVPTIALTNEIENSFIRRFRKVGINVIKELEYDEESNIAQPAILILTPEKLDLLVRKQPEILEELECIVFDEFHKISDGQRGWLEETLIAWFVLHMNIYNYKIVMMSAIVDGLKDSLSNIKATIYDKKWTPSKKLYGMFYLPEENKKVYGNNSVKQDEEIVEEYCLKIKYDFKLVATLPNVFQRKTFGKKRVDGKDTKRSDTKYDLCWKAVNTFEEDTILVYFYAKKDIKSFISKCEKYRDIDTDSRLESLKHNIARQLGSEHMLVKALDYKVGFHDGDLPEDVRSVIESAYKNKLIDVLACTTTLADGVNLPVSTLIVGTFSNFDNNRRLDLGDYKNIVGRIGRALIDTEGKIFLIKYPEVYKEEDVQQFNKYYYGERITNSLESAFDGIEGDLLIDVESCAYKEMDKERRNIKSMIERIQIFVFSLYEEMQDSNIVEFEEAYSKAFFLKHSANTDEIMNKYVSKYYRLACEIPYEFLQKCNKTGVSYETNAVLVGLAEEVGDFEDVYDILSENVYLKLLECNEFLPEDESVQHYNALMTWLEGGSYRELRDKYFVEDDVQNSTERCTKYIRRMFQYIVPWALSALLVYMDEKTDSYRVMTYLIRCVKYGSLEEDVVALCESGIKSRELAIDLNKLYVDDSSQDSEISEWVVNVQKERLEKSFGNKFDRYILEQVAKYRSIKREVSHYFEKSRAIICPVRGVQYYSYFSLGSNYFEENKKVVLLQDMNNEYDMYAVKVLTSDGKFMLGHIPMTCSEEVFDLIESGYQLKCEIHEMKEKSLKIRVEKVGL